MGLPKRGIEQFKSGFGGREIEYVGAWELTISTLGKGVLDAGVAARERFRRWRYRDIHNPDDPHGRGAAATADAVASPGDGHPGRRYCRARRSRLTTSALPGLPFLAVFARHPARRRCRERDGAVLHRDPVPAVGRVAHDRVCVSLPALVVPVLWWLTAREERVVGPRPWRQRRWALLAGVFAADLVLFHHGIHLMGAGLATVMSNVQVVIVLLATWAFPGERPSNPSSWACPWPSACVVLISGILGGGAYGSDPQAGWS
ncbi:MAG: hypothetical protein U0869_07290 [Chloroflexota bacterium]